ncbi:MAG: hypothetical protein K2Q17_17450 [Nitrospiraceae bacterium]|uniref:hypothetical protein n=1 Tax=Nitrospira cf. moscoviensis SBR1015 TaxID=96242 RepID=UPI000A0E4FE3|nr:hypothetical protein [Nitrospira cf. moscoviensis SBR1015]MBY0249443.1 hypothetical protein [Nitrospiraceae bacterium]OQW32509.1 MAG: hypothetical protein A4E20_13675 [Nitrospira sp. SG-bin2]
MTEPVPSAWPPLRTALMQAFPKLYELEPGGPLVMDLGSDGWILEVRPQGTVLCQYGVAMDDVMALMSEGTPEDLGTDEVAKQAKYFLQPAVSKYRALLLESGFSEETEMTDEFVAVTFARGVDVTDFAKVQGLLRWCCQQIGRMP